MGRNRTMRGFPIFFLLCAGLMAAPQARAHEENFEDRVRAYLLSNPEVILEALEVISQRQAQTALIERIAAHPGLFEDPPVLGLGDPAAPVRVVEFFDYKCAPCKAIHPDLAVLVTANADLRIEMKHLPILTPGSERAARFALATQMVYGNAAYAKVHNALWDVQGPLNTVVFQRIATDVGVDFAQIEPAMRDATITARIDGNRDIAIDLGVLGTPAFMTPNSLLIGETDIDTLAASWLSQ